MKTVDFLNRTVHEVVGCKVTEGNKIGLELELEGRNVALADVATRGWMRHADGSLRGESIEYTTNGGKEPAAAKKLVADLFKKFKEHGVRCKDSIRTSTHVHLNFTDKPFKQVINFFALFTMLEEILQYYSGEDRKGNLFCVASREAEGIVGIVANAVAQGDFSSFAGDRYKYSACNLSTIYKFGTIEVRTMKGASSAEMVNAWIDILTDMYEYSQRMKSPAELVTDLSHLGAEGLMRKIFTKTNYEELIRYFPAPQTLHYSLMEGARLIQIFAYEFEEAFTAKVEIKPKKEMKKADGNALPKNLPNGNAYQIYLPDGTPWNCYGMFEGRFWLDGEQLEDDDRFYWSQRLQRFVCEYPNGEIYQCRWLRHHALPQEVPPARREMPPWPDDAEEAVEVEFDEGDNF